MFDFDIAEIAGSIAADIRKYGHRRVDKFLVNDAAEKRRVTLLENPTMVKYRADSRLWDLVLIQLKYTIANYSRNYSPFGGLVEWNHASSTAHVLETLDAISHHQPVEVIDNAYFVPRRPGRRADPGCRTGT